MTNWQEQANCRNVDPEIFHPGRGESVKEALAYCAGCVVVQECLDYALDNGIKIGIYGGKSEKQRRIIRRQNK